MQGLTIRLGKHQCVDTATSRCVDNLRQDINDTGAILSFDYVLEYVQSVHNKCCRSLRALTLVKASTARDAVQYAGHFPGHVENGGEHSAGAKHAVSAGRADEASVIEVVILNGLLDVLVIA